MKNKVQEDEESSLKKSSTCTLKITYFTVYKKYT